jgi:hypothetical protein
MCGIVGAIPRLTQMVEGSCQVIPEGSAAAKFQLRVASPGICIFLKWSEREMRTRNGSSSALFRAYPEGLERLRTRLRFHVNSAEGKYVRGVEPFTASSCLEELGESRGDESCTGGRPRTSRSLRPGSVFSRVEILRGDWLKRSLEKKRRREGPVHEDPERTVLAPWLLGV